jgi:hypothetical protein
MSTINTTLTANSLNNIIIGDITTDEGIIINYSCSRGSLYSSGRIKVLSKVTSADVEHRWFGDDPGIDTVASPMAADISGNNIRLNITVDASDANDVTFNYNLEIIKL